MAISCDPDVIIADEPTTALDVTVQAAILELLLELRDRLGTAIVLITHNMGVVADMADRVVVMYRGTIVEEAPAQQLVATPRHPYTKLLLDAVPHLGRENGRLLDLPAGVHHHHPVAALGDDAEVVGDHDHTHAELALQPLDQVEDLRLDGDVEGGGRLIGDEKSGTAGERHGDHGALA